MNLGDVIPATQTATSTNALDVIERIVNQAIPIWQQDRQFKQTLALAKQQAKQVGENVPISFPPSISGGGIDTKMLLIGGGVLLAVILLMNKKRR